MRDEGVASVVGALLVAALLSGVLLTVQIAYVPRWEREREAEHARALEQGFLAVAATATSLRNSTLAVEAPPLPLAYDPTPVFGVRGTSSTLSFMPGAQTSSIGGRDVRVVVSTLRAGGGAGGQPEEWQPVPTPVVLLDVATIESLRIRISSGVAGGNHGDSIVLTATNRTGVRAAEFTFYVERFPSGYNLMVLSTDARGETLYNQGTAYFLQSALSTFWVDPLLPEYRFGAALAAAEAPLTFTVDVRNVRAPSNNLDLAAEYSISYGRLAAPGVVVPVPRGPVLPTYAATSTGGVLAVASGANHFVDQRWTIEGGGLLLAQADGAVFKSDPFVQLVRSGGTSVLVLRTLLLAGDAAAVASDGSAIVTFAPGPVVTTTMAGKEVSWTMRTSSPAEWSQLFARQAAAAGLVEGLGYTLVTAGDSIRITLSGPSESSALLHVQEVHARVRIAT